MLFNNVNKIIFNIWHKIWSIIQIKFIIPKWSRDFKFILLHADLMLLHVYIVNNSINRWLFILVFSIKFKNLLNNIHYFIWLFNSFSQFQSLFQFCLFNQCSSYCIYCNVIFFSSIILYKSFYNWLSVLQTSTFPNFPIISSNFLCVIFAAFNEQSPLYSANSPKPKKMVKL